MADNRIIGNIPNRDEKQTNIKYTIDKRIFIVNPIYKKSGEHIREILLKLMQSEIKKP